MKVNVNDTYKLHRLVLIPNVGSWNSFLGGKSGYSLAEVFVSSEEDRTAANALLNTMDF